MPTLVLLFLICNVILQYYLGYKYRRIYKVLVEDELSQEENNVPLIRAVGYAVDRIFLNIVYLVLFIFMGIGAISTLITNGAIGLVFLALSVIFFMLLRRSLKKSDLTGEEYEKDVERHYQLVKHLEDAATLFETISKR